MTTILISILFAFMFNIGPQEKITDIAIIEKPSKAIQISKSQLASNSNIKKMERFRDMQNIYMISGVTIGVSIQDLDSIDNATLEDIERSILGHSESINTPKFKDEVKILTVRGHRFLIHHFIKNGEDCTYLYSETIRHKRIKCILVCGKEDATVATSKLKELLNGITFKVKG